MLAIPGASSSALALIAPAAVSGIDVLDPRFAAILSQNEVAPDQMEALGKAGVKTTALYGHIARNEDKLELFLKRLLKLDADANPVARGQRWRPRRRPSGSLTTSHLS